MVSHGVCCWVGVSNSGRGSGDVPVASLAVSCKMYLEAKKGSSEGPRRLDGRSFENSV
jgi:hypothetical protein